MQALSEARPLRHRHICVAVPKHLSIHDQVVAHMEAKANCERYAKQALTLLEAGKIKEGKAAAKKAKQWEAKMLALEPTKKSHSQ